MKEIVLISAYTPTLEKQDKLRNLIISLKSFNYKVCLATHSDTPRDIIDRCEYFLYDKNNPILWDSDMKYWSMYNPNEFLSLHFKPQSVIATHGLALWRMYSGALSYLKSLNEEVVHMIEYDTIIKDPDYFSKNTSYLLDSSYASILYSLPRFHDNEGNLICNWPIQSVNVKKIPFNLLEFDFTKLKIQYKEYFHNGKLPVVECMFFDNIWSKLDYKLIKLNKESDISSLVVNTDHAGEDNVNKYTHINFYRGELHYFINNLSFKHLNYTIVADGITINTTIPPGNWEWKSLGIESASKIRFFQDNILVTEYDLSLQNDVDSIFKYSRVIIHNK
tara:strand:- start:2786 stop:3787 length:1002 start_codon:yes stop_codon:yes gene_type:complete